MDKKLIYLIVAIILAGCATNPNSITPKATITPPDIGIPTSENGEILSIIAPDGWNSFKVGEPVFLLINNLSNEQIIFEYNFGAKIYALQKDKWLEVKNNTVYPDTNKIILEPNKALDVFKHKTLIVLPDISSDTDATPLRIFVTGNMYGNGESENKKVIASYIDLQLNP